MRLTPRAVPLGVVLLVTSVTASSASAASPVLLPATKTAISVAGAKRLTCATRSVTGSTVSRRSVTAPANGSVTARLAGPSSSDWDLAVVDRATDHVLNGSAELGSTEIATTRVIKGQKLIIQACLRTGSTRTISQRVQFTKAELPKAGKLKLVRVNFRTDFDREAVATLNLDGADHATRGYQDVLLHGAADAAKLKKAGLSYTTRVADVVAQDRTDRLADDKRSRSAKGRKAARALTPGGRTSYRTLPEIQQELKDTAAANPRLVRVFALRQRSIEGRQIMGIEIAENVTAAPDGRPAFVTVGTHHAREWPSNEATQEFGLELINGYKSGNPDLTKIVKNGRTFVIPVLNVDGFDMTIESEGLNPDPAAGYTDPVDSGGTSGDQAEGSGAYKRKNCRAQTLAEQAIPCIDRTYNPATGDDQSDQNDRGVDLNRNYGVSWGGPGSASDIDDLTFHGPSAFSEPESRTFADFLRDQQVSLLFTNHTFSGLILRPPGTSVNGPAPDEQRLRQLGDQMAKNTRYRSQFSYQLYDTTGTTDDYIYDGLSGFSYTAEIGLNEFHPPYSQFQAEYDGVPEMDADGNPTGRKLGGLRRAYTLAGLAAVTAQDDHRGTSDTGDDIPATHGVIQGTAPAGSTLTIRKSFTYSTDPRLDDNGVQAPDATIAEPRISTLAVPASGQFVWHVDPSTQPGGEATPWKLSYTNSAGAETPCKDVYVALGQVVNVACGAASAPAACTNADGFKSVGVKRKGKGLRISFKRKVKRGVTVAIYQTSKGRKINKKAKRVARFRNRSRSFTWDGRKTSGKKTRVARGVYFVRFSIRDAKGKADVRRVVVAKGKKGRFIKKGKFILEHHC
jgi:murein tripeptide amidase MpaA